ncbi:hypothetical protein ABH937_004735 [Kitasatospora sp. GAS1066B]
MTFPRMPHSMHGPVGARRGGALRAVRARQSAFSTNSVYESIE